MSVSCRTHGVRAPEDPVVLLLSGHEDFQAVFSAACARADRPFTLAELRVDAWEDALSPWSAPAVFRGGRDFGGGAAQTLRRITEETLPELLSALGAPDAPVYLAGYSLAGLFALYALYCTPVFTGCVCASGSLWFPGFADFAAAHAMPRLPRRVYFSLGARESETKHPVLQSVGAVTERLHASCLAQGVDTVFVRNPGGHFQDPAQRLAQGIAWIVR